MKTALAGRGAPPLRLGAWEGYRSMAKYLCWGSLGTAGLLLVLFIADLVIKKPFSGLDPVVDVLGALASGLVGYVSWEAARDLS
jgi:hypothetical protein